MSWLFGAGIMYYSILCSPSSEPDAAPERHPGGGDSSQYWLGKSFLNAGWARETGKLEIVFTNV